jgi:hypothetical protein
VLVNRTCSKRGQSAATDCTSCHRPRIPGLARFASDTSHSRERSVAHVVAAGVLRLRLVSAWGWAGLVLILVGLLEFVFFRFVFANAAGIRGHMRLLMLNCAFNLVAGAVLLIIGLR